MAFLTSCFPALKALPPAALSSFAAIAGVSVILLKTVMASYAKYLMYYYAKTVHTAEAVNLIKRERKYISEKASNAAQGLTQIVRDMVNIPTSFS